MVHLTYKSTVSCLHAWTKGGGVEKVEMEIAVACYPFLDKIIMAFSGRCIFKKVKKWSMIELVGHGVERLKGKT